LIKTCGNLKDFLPEYSSTNALTKIEKTNIGRLSATSSIERTAGGHPELEISLPLPHVKTQ